MSGFVLNVNDDAASRYVVTRVLQASGFEVREAATGGEALALAREGPSLLVLDVHLPDLNGHDIARQLRADPATASIPILQTSATFVSDDSRVRGLESGADAYLTQPIDATVLVATARALLRAYAAERGLREAGTEWQRTFDGLGEPVMIMTRDGTMVRANRAMRELTGALDEGASADARLRASLGWTPLALRDAAAASAARASEDVEIAGRRFHAIVDPIPDEQGRIDRWLLVLQDVTDRWRLVEEERARAADMAESNRRKDQMLAMLAHELRNPLNAIATANTVQSRMLPGDPQIPALRATVARQTRNLTRLVDDLLEVSRFTRGRLVIQPVVVDVRDVVSRAVEGARALTDSRGQHVALALSPSPLAVHGDPLRLEQTFVNLLVNAAKFSEPGSDIAIIADAGSDGWAEVRVIDRGIGIDPARVDAIFDLFVQEDESLARLRGGLGLGLTLARHLVQLHGGTIEAFSKGLGEGSEFRVRLPLAAPAPAEPQVPEPETTKQQVAPLDILVVEDTADAAELLRMLLESWGHRVRTATDGISGLDAAIEAHPDAALIDIGLPGIDGYQVAENLRGSARTRDIYLVAITGYGRPEDRARAVAAGFDCFIVKPLDFDELARALAAAGGRA